jgi:hypothetical protein
MLLSEDEIKRLEHEITRLKNVVNNSVDMLYSYGDDESYPSTDEDRQQMIWSLRNMYKHVLVYLEARDFHDYKADFKKEFESVIDKCRLESLKLKWNRRWFGY